MIRKLLSKKNPHTTDTEEKIDRGCFNGAFEAVINLV